MRKTFSKVDYSKAMLPRTRKAQFGDCFKMNYVVILKCGLMLLLFFSPLIAFSLFADIFYVSLIENSTEAIDETKLLFHYLFNVGLILMSLFAVIGITGVARILRNLIWGEGIFFKDDFNQGVKQNAGKNIAFAAIFSLFYALSYFIYSLTPDSIISYLPILIFLLIFLPIYFWIIFLNNTYESKFFQLLKNGFYFYVKTIGWSILGVIMTIVLIALIFIPFNLIYIKYIALVLFVIFLYPIIILIMTLYTTSKFDDYINKDNYLDYYHRGLNAD